MSAGPSPTVTTVTSAPLGGETGGARLRIRLYALCLLASFALYALFSGLWSGTVAGACSVASLMALAGALVVPATMRLSLPLAVGAGVLAGATALAFPLGSMVLSGGSLPAVVRSQSVWPQILVLLFASRLVAEVSDLRFAAFWSEPLKKGGMPRTQSMLAAVLLGACLALVFYQVASAFSVATERLDPVAITWRAFTGQTPIHAVIVVLFFVIVAAIMDAALLSFNDTAVLNLLREICRGRAAGSGTLSRQDIAALAGDGLAPFAHTRAIAYVRDAARSPGDERGRTRMALDTFHAASRRLIRALLSFLPLLGFLGTVIGLTAAIGSLPANLGPGSGGSVDISGSLSGLAVKFETTLLGLFGGLVASLLLALVERREAELAAECGRLVDACSDADR